MKKKDTTSDGAAEWGSAPIARITPQEVQQKEFQVARFGAGYRMREVDEFLDQVTDALSALVAENERLLRGADREAERGPAPVRPVTDDADRAAVETFLRREKGFLQDLGGLVQGHAEELRSMVRAVRRDAVAPAVAPPEEESPLAPAAAAMTMPAAMSQAADEPGAPFEATADDSADDSGAIGSTEQTTSPPDAAAEEPGGDEGAEPGGSTTVAGAADDDPIRLDEPEPARSGRSDEDDDGSLRELFWGEE
jgi:DivIVA domain-containing protein